MRCVKGEGTHRFERVAIAAVLALLPSCGGSPTAPGPGPAAELAFTSSTLDLGSDLQAETTLRNVGTAAVGPITIAVGTLQLGGVSVPGASVEASPDEVPTLNPGAGVSVTVSVVSDVALQPRDESGSTMDGVQVAWTVVPPDAGLVTAEGRFVAYEPGIARLTASAGSQEATATVDVSPRGLAQGSFTVSGRGEQNLRFNSDLWVHGDCAYTGTWGDRQGQVGNTLNVWDISDPTAPQLTADVRVDARVVNDVKVRSDGKVAVISHEFSLDQLNGITLLALSADCNPNAISRFTTGLQSGIHNVWIEGDFVYVVTDGVGSGLRILDISDPQAPTVVAAFADPFSFLHDVYVRDGLAFLSHWDSGLIILDVGNGIVGGSPSDPREVSRVRTRGGQTHNAWYWPERGLVFVGEEDFNTPGMMHVVDVADLFAPVEVATFRIPADTPHNFWLDEEREILHMAWYTQGIISLDV
ncbi:MAG: hypothetical protein P8Y07_03260 [Gemmatimonadales bacterium]